MTLPELRRELTVRLKEAEPLDRPSELADPRGVAVTAAKRLGLLGYGNGNGELHQRAHAVDSAPACAAVLIDCLAALPPAEEAQASGSMSVVEVAEALGVSKATIYRLVSEQALPHSRVRGRITVS